MTPEPAPLCLGKSHLFDSVDPELHKEAAKICAVCPLTTWCEQQYRAAKLDAAYGGEPEGTWAGKLRKPRRPQFETRLTHCRKAGHERTPENLYPGGGCKPCGQARSAATNAARRQAKGEVA